MNHRYVTNTIFIAGFIAITVVAFYGASLIQENQELQAYVREFGVLGMVFTALIAGLNIIIPIHPATFAPIFLSAGFSLPVLILSFTLGTTIADSVGYALGHTIRNYDYKNISSLAEKVTNFFNQRQRWLLPLAGLYIAFAPLPNEFIMIPFGIAGYQYRHLLIPLLIGNIVHHTVMTYGAQVLFSSLFI